MYHYADVTIDAQSDVARRAVLDRVKAISENKEPDQKVIERFVQWLNENHIMYGYGMYWSPTEKLPVTLLKSLPDAASRGVKSILLQNDRTIRLIAIYSTQPAPIDPIMGRSSAAEHLIEESKTVRMEPTMNRLLSNAGVVVYDAGFKKSLNLPVSTEGKYVDSIQLRQRLPIIWNFALMLLAPVALYFFFRDDESVDEALPSSVIERLFSHVIFRSVATLALAGFVGATMYEALDSAYGAHSTQQFLVNGALGLLIGAAILAASYLVAPVRNMLSGMRWLPVSLIIALQILGVVIATQL